MGLSPTLSAFLLANCLILMRGLAFTPVDTTGQKEKPLSFRTVSRIHSGSFFYFGGKVAERNPGFDFSIVLESRSVGYSFLKAADLTDIHSSFNFALATVYKNVDVNKKLRFTPQILVLIEQPYKLVDQGSDIGVTFTSSYRVNKHLILDQTAICFNMVFENSHLDFINRFRLAYSHNHVDLAALFWHNNNLFDHETHFTSAISVAYNRIKISGTAWFGASLTASSTLASSDADDVPTQEALMVSVSFTTFKN